jgi:filamentous hemagglutinin
MLGEYEWPSAREIYGMPTAQPQFEPGVVVSPHSLSVGSESLEASPLGYWSDVGEVFKGYGDAAVGTVQGAWFVVRHPVQTVKGVGTSIAHPIQTANAIWDDISEKSGTLRGQGSLVGDVLIGVASGGTIKAVSKTATVAKLTNQLKHLNHADNAADFAKYRAALAQQEIAKAPRVGSALKADKMHKAGTFVVDEIGEKAQVFGIRGGDGIQRTLVQMPGSVNGQQGIFEWILEQNGDLSHQRFIPGAPVSGIPNLPPSQFPK